ncbi:hypothetical protein G9A89_005290 [Geosiphon pyriformis]|nr:hypothetical protein G9A89_005290 [Geosiphon pyriformis]
MLRQFSVFDKKFKFDEEFENVYSSSYKSTTTSDPRPEKLTGAQFWPVSSPITSPTSADGPTSCLSPNDEYQKQSSPVQKIFGKIIKRLNQNDLLKRRGSNCSQISVESVESVESMQSSNSSEGVFNTDYLSQTSKSQPPPLSSPPSPSPSQPPRLEGKKKKASKNKRVIKKLPPKIITMNLGNHSILLEDIQHPPPNLIARSKHHSFSYPPHLLQHPYLSPDEKTMFPVTLVNFSIYLYWAWPHAIQLSLPRTTSLSQFKNAVSRELEYLLPADSVVLCHTKKSHGERMNNTLKGSMLLQYLISNHKIRMVDSDAVWGICMLLWPKDVEV